MDTLQFLEWLETASVKELEAFGRDPRDPSLLMAAGIRAVAALAHPRWYDEREGMVYLPGIGYSPVGRDAEDQSRRWRPTSASGHWEWS